MQLPSSIPPLSQPLSSSRPSPSSSTPATNRQESLDVEQTQPGRRAESNAEDSASANERQAEARFERTESTNESEPVSQDLVAREQSQQSSANPAVNQYQRVAQEGAVNAQTQDPSLFRVDVYV